MQPWWSRARAHRPLAASSDADPSAFVPSQQLANHKLLIIDEPGFVPLSKTRAELLFELVTQPYKRAAVLCHGPDVRKCAMKGSTSPRSALETIT